MPEILTSDMPVWNAIEMHLNSLWERAKRERQPRTTKWLRNLATERGECVGVGGQGGDASKPETDGGWQAGRAINGGEKLRIARQKIVAAKDIIGDSVYKANNVPFLLKWRVGTPMHDDPSGSDVLATITEAVKELVKATDTADQMRKAVEDGASFGEYWLRACEYCDDILIENPTPWEMYIDAFNETDVQKAEYVIRDQNITPYTAVGMVSGSPNIFDRKLLASALHGATPGSNDASGQENPAVKQRSGKLVAKTVSWREIWANVPGNIFSNAQNGLPEGFVEDDPTELLDYVPVWGIMCGGRLVSCIVEPGERPFDHFVWQWNRMEEQPEGINDELECSQTLMTGLVRSWAANVRESSRITLAGHPGLLRTDPKEIVNGVKFVAIAPECRTVNDAVQQFKIDPCTDHIQQGVDMMFNIADMECAIPRVLQGVQPDEKQTTAFEIRNRLNSAGKHLGEAVRMHDKAIVWVIECALKRLAGTMVIPEQSLIEIEPSGFSAYSDLVTRHDALVAVLQYTQMNPKVDEVTKSDVVVKKLAESSDLPVNEIYKTADEVMQEQQAQAAANEEQMRLQQETVAADNEVKRAKAAKDQATAQDLADKTNLARAEFVRQIENDAAGGMKSEGREL